MNSRTLNVASRCFFSALLIFTTVSALAQAGRGSVSGTVTDPNGAVVPGSQVTLLNKATGVSQHTVTSGAGLYTFISLNPGKYQVTASQSGFSSVAQDNVTVNVDQTSQVNITLRVGAATETVTVTQTAELVEPSNSTVGSLIPAETIDRVPLLYRNVYDLAQLSAGVTPPNGSPNSSDSMQTIQNISAGRPGVDISSATINGAIVGSVYYMLDGSPVGIAENNAAAIIPAMNIPEDGVEEVRVETQDTPASYQSGAAGVISLVSKSGTNRFHGDIFGVFRPNALSANDYFNKDYELANGLNNAPPSFYRYQEGAAIGGPIKKDKLFFFGDYEDTQQQQFEGIKTYAVPTSLERTGNFSAMGFTIYDPTQPDDADGNRIPFPGNIIPNPNPIGLLYLSKMPKCNYPSPTTCDSATSDVSPNFAMPGLDPLNGHKFDVRVDWAKSEKQRIFTRFSYDKLSFATANVFPSGWDPDYAENITNGRNILVADDLTLNSSTVLSLRYSFTRHYENQGNPAYENTDITSLGFPASLASQVVYKQLPFMVFNDFTSTVSNTAGVGGTADYNNFRYASENSDANAAITRVHGKHEISFGFEWMKRYLNVGQPPAPAGSYLFDVSATDQSVASVVGGSDFASFLIGMGTVPGTENSSYPNFTKDVFAAESNPYYATFIEDTYHPTEKLTITAGLRWDIFGGRNERFNRQEYFNPTITGSASGVSFTGAEIYVNGGNRSPFTTNLHNFGPRLAFAWQPISHMVVRGGAGFYYGPSTHNVGSALLNTDGFSSQTLWNATCTNLDGNTVFNGTSCGVNAGSALDVFTGPYSLSNPFPTPPGTPGGIVPVFTTGATGLANNFGIGLSTVLRSQRTPTIYNFNFALEYELPHQVVVTAGYVGSRGLFLPLGSVDLNVLDVATIEANGANLCVTNDPTCSTAPYTGPVTLNPNLNPSVTDSSGVPLWADLEPFPQFGNGSYSLSGGTNGVVVNGYPGGDSEYSSLQTKVQKRLTGHFTTLATFTWGKIMTDDGNPPLGFVGSHLGSAQDWRDLQYEHSISPQDVKYQFTGEVSYDLPVGKGMALNLSGISNAVLGGWTVNAIGYLSTGVPIASPPSGTPIGYLNQRSDVTCNPAVGAPHTVAAWFNDTCFAMPGSENGGPAAGNPFIPGTAPAYLDNVRTRGARDLDLSIYKTFALGEHKELRFDISSYNTTNTPQYGYPSVPSLVGVVQQRMQFGLITNNNNTPRQFQFGARFTF
jgi:Carboxypeptidase regulatory-like domain